MISQYNLYVCSKCSKSFYVFGFLPSRNLICPFCGNKAILKSSYIIIEDYEFKDRLCHSLKLTLTLYPGIGHKTLEKVKSAFDDTFKFLLDFYSQDYRVKGKKLYILIPIS